MFILFDACVFVMWFGAWSACHGLGAWGTAALWTVFLYFAFVAECIGRGKKLVSLGIGKIPVAASLLVVTLWILYFFGLGDWMRLLLPKSFPEGGAAYALSRCGLLQIAVLIVWAVVRFRNLWFICTHLKTCAFVLGLSGAIYQFKADWRKAFQG